MSTGVGKKRYCGGGGGGKKVRITFPFRPLGVQIFHFFPGAAWPVKKDKVMSLVVVEGDIFFPALLSSPFPFFHENLPSHPPSCRPIFPLPSYTCGIGWEIFGGKRRREIFCLSFAFRKFCRRRRHKSALFQMNPSSSPSRNRIFVKSDWIRRAFLLSFLLLLAIKRPF